MVVELTLLVSTSAGSLHEGLQGHRVTNRTHLPQLQGRAASQRTACQSGLCGDLVHEEAALDNTLLKMCLCKSMPEDAVGVCVITKAGCDLNSQEPRTGTQGRSHSHNSAL